MSGDHREPRAVVLLHGSAELEPRAALSGAPRRGRGLADVVGDGHLVILVVEAVLAVPETELVDPGGDRRREDETTVTANFIAISPPYHLLVLSPRSRRHGWPGCSLRAFGLACGVFGRGDELKCP